MKHVPVRHGTLGLAAALATLVPPGCGDDAPFSPPYDPQIPTEWVGAVTHELLSFAPGTTWEYRGDTEEGEETILVEVLAETRVVNGVTATVVRDRVFLDGELREDTRDWYAQDADGNVWYLGEESEELDNGVVVSTEGSWTWGVDGALPGVIMWADPAAHLNEDYRQEFFAGEAEDWGRVVGLDESVQVSFGAFDGCTRTEDWNGLEGRSESLEHKTYCPGVGVVLEVPADDPAERVELVALNRP